MKKVLDIFKKPLWLLCLGLGIVLFASIFANMANTSMYSVSVTEISFETEREGGELTGLLYRPKSCTKDNPCATIVTTHGFLNSKEMQDAPAVELSKRGYVVLVLDQYDHGDSVREETGFDFWLWSQYDAVKYMYDQDYVLKAADGTGMIAVSGHSMGGFGSRIAAYWDSMDGGNQMISAVLAVGADFQWINSYGSYGYGFSAATVIAADKAAQRTVGTIAGQYDEFFFLDSTKGGTVKEKDWTNTVNGAQFYYADTTIKKVSDFEEFDSGEWNDEAYGGAGSVIYVPSEIHPWNHFSTESTAYMVEFYTKAFKTQMKLHEVTENDGVVAYEEGKLQSWWLKEGFECIGLAGMFIAIIAAISLLATLPFFNKVTTAEVNEVKAPTGVRAKLMKAFLVVSCFSTAYLYPMLQLGTSKKTLNLETGVVSEPYLMV
jgi:pimeloyl-ACP methyl ester carboxylesterase